MALVAVPLGWIMIGRRVLHTFNQLRKLLPGGQQDFAWIRAHGLIYVDKTRYLYQLATINQPLLLTRPRRFGKSTLVSTLEELFLHGVAPYDGHDSLFKGLDIEPLWPQDPDNEGPFYVLHLDFWDLIKDCNSVAAFKQCLNEQILHFATESQLELKTISSAGLDVFKLLLDAVPDGSVVLLVDEYDAPLTHFLGSTDSATSEDMAQVLRGFFANVKVRAQKFRFTFITGITRLKDTSIFTAGNTIADISQDPEFGAICGVTREEIQRYFPEHLRYAASQWLQVPLEQVCAQHVEQLLNEMTEWYDGYCFDSHGATHVFCLWSILCFFREKWTDFDTFWFDSGGLPEILRKCLFNSSWPERLNLLAGESVQVSRDAFLNPSTLATMQPEVLLFQTGYLTLKTPYRGAAAPDKSSMLLGIPNKEMEDALSRLYCVDFLANTQGFKIGFIAKLRTAIDTHDETALQKCFNELLQGVDYEHYPLTQESGVTNTLYIGVSLALHIRVIVNHHEAKGRADLLFVWQQTTVVIEFKYAHKLTDCDNLLQQAVAQVLDRNYGDTFAQRQHLWRLAMVFCAESREISAVQTVSLQSFPCAGGPPAG